jgi:hypothetical protein
MFELATFVKFRFCVMPAQAGTQFVCQSALTKAGFPPARE